MRRTSGLFAALAIAVALTGCGDDKNDAIRLNQAGVPYNGSPQEMGQVTGGYQQAPMAAAPGAPVIINQQPAAQHDSTMQDMLLGGLIGHAIGSSGNNSRGFSSDRERVVERHYYNNAPAAAPTPKPQTSYAPAPAPKPAPTYSGWSKPSAPATTSSSSSYSGWSKPATTGATSSFKSSSSSTRSSYSGFSRSGRR